MDTSSTVDLQQSAHCPLEDLDANILISILKWLGPEEVVAASLTCKLLQQSAEAGVVWRHLYDTALCGRVKEQLLPPPEQITDWKGAVVRGRMLSKLQYGTWERLSGRGCGPGGWAVRPCAREGHAAASWGRDSMILFGGWGSGIRNDLFILDRLYEDDSEGGGAGPSSTKPAEKSMAAAAANSTSASRVAVAAAAASQGLAPFSGDAAAAPETTAAAAAACPSGSSSRTGRQDQQGTASASDGGAAAAAAGAAAAAAGTAAAAAPWLGPGELRPCRWLWRVPKVAGRRPSIRYGHSVTRCGVNGELLAVYGGMQAGGYTAEISALAILRPYTGTLPGYEGCPGPGCDYEYEWYHPQLSGPDPGARGYHAACASEDGRKLYVFGGIAGRDSITRLSVIDLTTWTVECPDTIGLGPSPRFGCSLVVYGKKLWVVGGGNGSDLARSGFDLDDCFTLDLASLAWNRLETTNQPHDIRTLGRCHASTQMGSKLVMFGGSLQLGNDITWLDLDYCTWGRPAVIQGPAPGKRMSAVVALSGSDLLVFGGWIYSSGEMGDLSRLRLLPTERELRAAKQQKAASTATAAEVAGGSSTGLGGGGSSTPVVEQLAELLNSKIARYYTLMRRAQEREEDGGRVPLALVREMRETMTAIRLLRYMQLRDDGEGGAYEGGYYDDDDDDDDANEQQDPEADEDADDQEGSPAGAAVRRGGAHRQSGEGSGDDESEGEGSGDEGEHDSDETGEEETEEGQEGVVMDSEEEEEAGGLSGSGKSDSDGGGTSGGDGSDMGE